MHSFKLLLTLAACTVLTLAASDTIHAHCDEPKLLHDTPIDVDGNIVSFTGFSCTPRVESHAISKRTSVNVCGTICSDSCNNAAGNLPPIIDDCTQIKNAITIFAGKTSPTFVVAPNSIQALTFGTCLFFFKNTDAYDQLEYCWSDLSVQASSAASACFPPVMPISSEGLCTASDQTWAVGAAHS